MRYRLLKPLTFNGIGLTTSGRRAFFDFEGGAYDSAQYSPVAVDRLGRFPSYVRNQPSGKTLPLKVVIKSPDVQAQFDRIARIFDPANEDNIFRAEDCDGLIKRLTCAPQQIIMENDNAREITVTLFAADPIWLDDTLTTITKTIIAAGNPQTFTPFNIGSAETYPVFRIIPRTLRTAAQGYLRMKEITYCNRSEFALTGPASGTWLIDVTNGGWDTHALVLSGEMAFTDGRDIAVFIDGIKVPDHKVYLDDMDSATTKVWVEIADAPARWAKIRAVLAAGGLVLTFYNDQHGFIAGDYLVWTNNGGGIEKARVSSVDKENVTITRTVHNCAAAGATAIDTTIYKSGHRIQLAWGFTGATLRPTAASIPDWPLINLQSSTNLAWEWVTIPYWPDGNRRPGGWRRILYDGREDVPELKKNRLSAKTALTAITFGGNPYAAFYDIEPTAAIPNYDAIEFRACCGIDNAAGAIEYNAILSWPFNLQIIGRDLLGIDSIIFNRLGHESGAGFHLALAHVYTNQTETPTDVLSTVIFRARNIILTCCRPGDGTLISLSQALTTNNDVQGFHIDDIANIVGLVGRVKDSVAGNGFMMRIYGGSSSGGPDTLGAIVGPFTPLGGIGGSLVIVCFYPNPAATYTTDIPVLIPGDYFISFDESGAVGDIQTPRSSGSIYGLGDHWRYIGGIWTQLPAEDVWFAILSTSGDNQEDTLQANRSGEPLLIGTIKLTFDPARTPIVDPRPDEDAYYLNTTWQRAGTPADKVDLQYLNRWADAQDVEIEIDTAARTVIDKKYGDSIRQCLLAQDDPWFRFLPGSNTFTVTASIGAEGEEHTVEFRSAWQA